MTLRQTILKFIYPLFSFYSNKRGAKSITNANDIVPPVSIYSLDVILTDGSVLSLEKLRGKKLLLVNTASDCGYTFQYDELRQLYENSKPRLEIIAFPSNDFKDQEKGTDEEIARFCSINYNIQFPIAKKSQVVTGPGQHPVFHWLTDKKSNGWNNHPPSWNFSKYLVNEEGKLTDYFDPAISPLGRTIAIAVNK